MNLDERFMAAFEVSNRHMDRQLFQRSDGPGSRRHSLEQSALQLPSNLSGPT